MRVFPFVHPERFSAFKAALWCGIFLFLSAISLQAQIPLDNWQTYSSLKDIRGAVTDSRGRVWAATSGGLFVYTPSTGDFEEFRNTNGLLTLDLTAIRADTAAKKIYFGAADGTISIADEDFRFTHVLDIKTSPYTRPRINDILLRDSIAFIATDFGITLMNTRQRVFVETIDRIGSFQTGTSVKKLLLLNDTLWAATDAGVARTFVLAQTLRNPQGWKVYQQAQGLPENLTVGIVQLDGVIHAATSKGIVRLEDTLFTKIYDTEELLNTLSVSDGSLYYTNSFYLYKAPSEQTVFRPEYFGTVSGHVILAYDRSIMVFFKNTGAAIIKGSDTTYIIPNTPTSNNFSQVALDRDGNVWNLGNVNPSLEAFSILKNGSWEIINNREFPVLGKDNYHRISIPSDGSVWLSSYGGGLTKVTANNDSYSIIRYDTSNTPIRGITNTPGYIVISETETDASGTLWGINSESPNSLLIARASDGEFHLFQPNFPASQRFFRNIAIDRSGTKWLSSYNGNGLYWFNENRTLDNTADDKQGILLTSNSSLVDNSQEDLAIDRNGALWIGTASGAYVMFNPGAILTGATPSIRRINQLAGQYVNDILVDALDNKWIATRNGVYVVNPDGTEVLQIFKADSVPLADSDVRSMAIDDQTGRIYFGTTKGLSSASSLSIMPLGEYSIKTYPQPYIPSRDGVMDIDGLAADSHVRILTLDGELIYAFDTQSRRAVWDGTTTAGEEAPSGVYIISAISRSAGNSSAGKTTLIRK